MRGNYEDATVETMDLDHYDLLQLKFDGMWVQVEIDGREAKILNRHGKPVEVVELADKHPRSVFVGEWMKGTQRTKGQAVHVVAFDCATANGWNCESRTYLERMEEFKAVKIPNELKNVLGRVVFPETWHPREAETLWKDVETGKEEGLILRRNAMPFGATVARVQPLVEVDFYATGIPWKNGKPVAVGGSEYPGGPELVKARLTVGSDYSGFQVGRCFKVQGQARTERGSVRFPFFRGWHLEK